jgi:hypothetical protein
MGLRAGELARDRHDPARHVDALIALLERVQTRH